MFDEALLARLDQDEAVQREGRLAVLRRAAKEYLKRQAQEAISLQYMRAYKDLNDLGEEFAGWEQEGAWLGA